MNAVSGSKFTNDIAAGTTSCIAFGRLADM